MSLKFYQWVSYKSWVILRSTLHSLSSINKWNYSLKVLNTFIIQNLLGESKDPGGLRICWVSQTPRHLTRAQELQGNIRSWEMSRVATGMNQDDRTFLMVEMGLHCRFMAMVSDKEVCLISFILYLANKMHCLGRIVFFFQRDRQRF